MDLYFGVAVVVMIVGLILYLVATPPKPAEVGRLMFFGGLFVALLRAWGHVALHGSVDALYYFALPC